MDNILNIVVRKRDGIVFAGTAKSFSSLNDVGPFDILPQHTNFVSVINDKLQIIRPDNKITDILITRGVVRVRNNEVEVFLGV